MDVLSFCHIAQAEMGAKRGHLSRLKWYLCKPGAKVFPFAHAFGNTTWEPNPEQWTEGPGVIHPPVKFSRKRIPCPDGLEFHGEVAWYQTGIPEEVFDNPGPYKRPQCPGYVREFDCGSLSAVEWRDQMIAEDFGTLSAVDWDYWYTP